jgi:hypothetical protein
MLHNPLLNRFKIIKISPPSVDEWARWMDSRYGDAWDRRVYVFLKRFESDGYLIKLPKTPEGLEEYPTPRTWTWLSLDLAEGFDSLEDICGLVGEEVGMKFHAFTKLDVDIEELIKNPEMFGKLELDAKYMSTFMLASWISQHIKNVERAYGLIDAMSNESREFLVMVCMSMRKGTLVRFLKQLLADRRVYLDVLSEITETISNEISVKA